MQRQPTLRAAALFLFCAAAGSLARGQTAEFFPLEEVRPGMRGEGRTVFEGEQPERFEVEVLGVLANVGPKQSIILARLSGGPLEKTGVMAGMSGSPVYLDGKLAGAVAYSFAFSKEPIAGIRPIEEMIRGLSGKPVAAEPSSAAAAPRLPLPAEPRHPLLAQARLAPPGPEEIGSDPQLKPIATPLALAGFPASVLAVFRDPFRALGLQPMQGVAGRLPETAGEVKHPLEPGSMITVGLLRGDFEVSAAGTVTHVDGDRLYAFGHRFLSSGPVALPVMRSRVLTLLPNLANSFKITGSGEVIGKIDLDQSAGVSGLMGGAPEMLPLEIGVTGTSAGTQTYRIEMARDPFLTPFLLQLAVFAAADATERQVGPATYRLRGAVEFEGGKPALRLDDVYTGASSVPLQVAMGTAVPLAYVLQGGVERLQPRRISLAIEAEPSEQVSQLVRAWAGTNRVRRGESLELAAVLRDAEGREKLHQVEWRVPLGAAKGEVFVTFSDAQTLNLIEWQSFGSGRRARNATELIQAVNRFRRSDRLYVRIWRRQPAFRLQTERLPAPPPSVAAVLSAPAATGSSDPEWHSTLAEFDLESPGGVVQGSVTLKVAVTE